MKESWKMPTYEVLVRDTRHDTVSCYTFFDYAEAMDFYYAEKRATESHGQSRGISISKPVQSI